ncbi:hypothetical protein evm_013585 [Chilo suppressalis]|nr:hypothetical protein evm_013585 [Chilo suppressalis]
MEGFVSPTINSAPALSPEDICENATILDEGIRLCPLCASEVRLFFINFNEKVQMCENVECEYPFGHENIVYVKEDNEAQSDEEVASVRSRTIRGSNATLSVVSTAAWSEIAKINRVFDAEDQLDSRSETREYHLHKLDDCKIKKEEDKQKKILQKVEEIKNLNKELNKPSDDLFVKPQIKNEKFIKHLMSMQTFSGVPLLKPEEMKLLDTKQPVIGTGELKIDINMGNDCKMSTVKIEIANLNQ